MDVVKPGIFRLVDTGKGHAVERSLAKVYSWVWKD
jgi:hypothetical protein